MMLSNAYNMFSDFTYALFIQRVCTLVLVIIVVAKINTFKVQV